MKCDFLHFSFFRFCLVFVLITVWLFSGWPQIWQNPSVPPEVKVIRAAEYLTNPSFTEGTTNWTLSVTTYDSTTYQDTAGSINTDPGVGRNNDATGYTTQTISTTINSSDTVNLSLYFQKTWAAIASRNQEIYAQIAKPSAPTTWVTIWSNTTVYEDSGWVSVGPTDVSSYFDETGTYGFRFWMYPRNGNNLSAATNLWVDNVSLDVVSVGLSTAIEIRAQDYSVTVSTITFPEGVPETTVSQPYNNVDGSGNPQVFGGAGTAKPVVTLFNGSAGSLIIWYNITTFTNGIVSSENYIVNDKGAVCTDADCITGAVTFDIDTTTGVTIAAGAGNEKDLYLKIILSSVAGKTGESTLTILGETP